MCLLNQHFFDSVALENSGVEVPVDRASFSSMLSFCFLIV